MQTNQLLQNLKAAETFALGSKWSRLRQRPIQYAFGMLYRHVFYKQTGNGMQRSVPTFFNRPMQINLPASMDLYLSGAKTHASEINLSRFLITKLTAKDTFLDIGAHVGYFSLLASLLVEGEGRVIAVEASPQTVAILDLNAKPYSNIQVVHNAVSDCNETIDFLEFPVMYNEYNTFDQTIYANESWFSRYKPTLCKVQAVCGSDLIQSLQVQPTFIKIDVEGAEEKVIRGLLPYLETYHPVLIMEFAHISRGNANHVKADTLLRNVGYQAYSMNTSGGITVISEPTDSFINKQCVDSDNIVYRTEVEANKE